MAVAYMHHGTGYVDKKRLKPVEILAGSCSPAKARNRGGFGREMATGMTGTQSMLPCTALEDGPLDEQG